MLSRCRASERSLTKIKEALEQAQGFLQVSNSSLDWTSGLYQYANRLAHLYFLQELNNIPAHLVFILFVNDQEMKGPTSKKEWRGALTLAQRLLGLSEKHRLSSYVHHLFVDIQGLAKSVR